MLLISFISDSAAFFQSNVSLLKVRKSHFCKTTDVLKLNFLLCNKFEFILVQFYVVKRHDLERTCFDLVLSQITRVENVSLNISWDFCSFPSKHSNLFSWFHTYRCWSSSLNCDLWLTCLVTCNSTIFFHLQIRNVNKFCRNINTNVNVSWWLL